MEDEHQLVEKQECLDQHPEEHGQVAEVGEEGGCHTELAFMTGCQLGGPQEPEVPYQQREGDVDQRGVAEVGELEEKQKRLLSLWEWQGYTLVPFKLLYFSVELHVSSF